MATAARLERLDPTSGATGGRTGSSGAGPAPAVTPRGYAALGGPLADEPGAAAVSGPDLWTLTETGSSCQVTQLHPVATGRNGLTATPRAKLSTGCDMAAAEAGPAAVGVASPGRVRLFLYDPHNQRPGRPIDVPIPGTRTDSRFLPAGTTTGMLWYLAGPANGAAGWSVFGVSPTGKVTGPSPLTGLGRNSDPAPPVESGGTALHPRPGQPRASRPCGPSGPPPAAMIPLPGLATYPARAATEKASFTGAEVVERRTPGGVQQPGEPPRGRGLHGRHPRAGGGRQELGGSGQHGWPDRRRPAGSDASGGPAPDRHQWSAPDRSPGRAARPGRESRRDLLPPPLRSRTRPRSPRFSRRRGPPW